MRKVWAGVLLLSLMVVGSVISSHNVSAYFKDNCYATQYEEIVNLRGEERTQKRNVYSSDSVCYSNGSLSVKDRPNKKSTMGIGLPAITHLGRTTPRYKIDGKKVVLTYCPDGRMVCAGNGKEKSFSLDDYGGDFEKLARDMDSFIAGLGNPKYCTKLDFGKNDVVGGTITASDGDASGSDTTEGGEDGETAYAGDACYNANANSQGWILCPTMRNLEYTAGSMDNILERWLSVDTNLYNASSPTAVVWEVMRNIANVIMVIIMLVIIFSQLTGVGIDNYGIKKMLPRLIAMAILINLSLVICELAIDLSNLLGTGLRNLFGAIGQGILEGRDAGDYVETFISTMVSVVMVAAGVIGAVAPTALTVHSIGAAGGASTTMIILVIVLVLLVVFAAIAVFFVMLAARMIIIIGCVALAPVAFALYILPNTQGLFKKWFTAFKTALVVFPICGAVSGISYIIKGIVLTADEIHIWMGVVGMMAPFLVFFMLPSLLRGVLGTLGKVGDALTTMGSHVQRGARGISSAVQDTDRFKDSMRYARDTSSLARAERLQRRYENRGLGNLSRRQMNRYARATTTAEGIKKERSNEQTLVADRRFADEGMGQLMDRWNEAFDNGDTEQLDALTNVLNRRYGAGAAAEIGSSLGTKYDVAHNANYQASLQSLRQTMSNNSDLAGNMRNKASDAYQMIADAGMANVTNKETGESEWRYADLGHFSENNNITSNARDWSTQSSAALQRAVDSGALNEDMIRTILNSDDPSIKSGIQSEEKKRDVLQNALYNIENKDANPEIGPPLPSRIGAERYRESHQPKPVDARPDTNVGGPGGVDHVSE